MRTVLSRAYEAVVQLRNSAFDRGLFRTHRAPVPVISVGNITAGGSGKTPVVEHLVRFMIDGGWMPAVVTRGYRRESRGLLDVSDGRGRFSSARESGDEAMQILLITLEPPLTPDTVATGNAVRTMQLESALNHAGHQVTQVWLDRNGGRQARAFRNRRGWAFGPGGGRH